MAERTRAEKIMILWRANLPRKGASPAERAAARPGLELAASLTNRRRYSMVQEIRDCGDDPETPMRRWVWVLYYQAPNVHGGQESVIPRSEIAWSEDPRVLDRIVAESGDALNPLFDEPIDPTRAASHTQYVR